MTEIKHNIPANIIDGLKLTHQRVDAALKAFDQAQAERSARIEMVEKMQTELDADELALDYTNIPAVGKIQARKAGLLGLRAKSASVDLDDPASKRGVMAALQFEFNSDFCRQLREHATSEVGRYLKPLFADPVQVNQITEAADCVVAIRHYVAVITGSFKLAECDGAARNLVAPMERLFAGENVFQLPAAITQ